MTLFCRLSGAAFFAALPILASASALDFKANVLDPPPANTTFPTFVISASPFTVKFTTCVQGELPNGLVADGCFAGVNRTGLDWIGMKFVFPNDDVLDSQPTDCSPAASNNIFSDAKCSLDGPVYNLIFTDGVLHDNEFFFVTETGVPADLFPEGIATVTTAAATTPEPATFFLLASGMGSALFARKRFR